LTYIGSFIKTQTLQSTITHIQLQTLNHLAATSDPTPEANNHQSKRIDLRFTLTFGLSINTTFCRSKRLSFWDNLLSYAVVKVQT